MYLCDGHHIRRYMAVDFCAFMLYLVLFSKDILYHYLKMKLKYSTRPLKNHLIHKLVYTKYICIGWQSIQQHIKV